MEPLARIAPVLDGDPVAVVGAGPVGQTAALLLARWGLPVVLLDARPAREPVGSKALCQARDVLDVWDAVGAAAPLLAEGVTWTTARTYYREREIAAWSFVDRGASPLPPYVNIGQNRTEEVLDGRLEAAGIATRWGTDVAALDQDPDGVTLRLSGGEGDGEEVRASHAVLATGAHGDRLRHALGLPFDGRTFDDRFLICDIRTDLPGWEHERRFWFDPPWNPGRQVLIHPCPGSTYRIDWQVPEDYDLDADEASSGLDRRIRQIVGDRPYEVVWKSAYRFHSRMTPRMRVGRVLLAGDIAHLVAPFGARGLNTGVLDADAAAWRLAFVRHGWAPEDLLESYDTERVAASRENLEVTGATMDFLVPQDEAGRQRRRDLLEAAARDPEAARRIDSGRFAEPFWYVDSPLTTPDPSRPFAGRPPKGTAPAPAPGIAVPDVPVRVEGRPEVTRLRHLAREGVLLLTGDEVDPREVRAALAGLTLPAAVHAMRALDPTGRLAEVLDAEPVETWVVRPDAHVAAVAAHPGLVRGAVLTATGHGITGARWGTPDPDTRHLLTPTINPTIWMGLG